MRSSLLIGDFIKVGLAYASDENIRYIAASGGAVSSILMYLLDSGFVDAVLVPRLRVIGGRALGKYEIVYDSRKLVEYVGSIYAPVDMGDVMRNLLNKKIDLAVVGTPCLIRGLRRAMARSLVLRENIKILLGLYCINVPNSSALAYVARTLLKVDPEEISYVKFRGCGWPGYTTVVLKTGDVIRVPVQAFWASGFGQYFYSRACFLCSDQTAESADISFADPWTYQKNIGIGKTLIVIRSKTGLDVVYGAVNSGYLVFEELASHLYAVQYATLLKKTMRATTRAGFDQQYILPPSIMTTLRELDYLVGSRLAKKESLWPVLNLYTRIHPYLFKPLVLLDYLLKPRFIRILTKVSRAWISR